MFVSWYEVWSLLVCRHGSVMCINWSLSPLNMGYRCCDCYICPLSNQDQAVCVGISSSLALDLDESSATVYPRTSDSETDTLITSKPRKKQSISSGSDGECSPISEPPSKKRKIVKTEDDCTPLPDPFPLPKHFPHDVEVALKRRKLSSSEKRRFISEVASAMLRFKRYPSREDYLCVARSIVATYPFFKSSDAKLYVSNIK